MTSVLCIRQPELLHKSQCDSAWHATKSGERLFDTLRFFYSDGSTQSTGTQKIVTATMTAAALRKGLGMGNAGNLGKNGQGIKFTQ